MTQGEIPTLTSRPRPAVTVGRGGVCAQWQGGSYGLGKAMEAVSAGMQDQHLHDAVMW